MELIFFSKALLQTVALTGFGYLFGAILLGAACLGVLKSRRFRVLFLLVCKFFQTVPFLILLFWVYFGWGFVFEKFFSFAVSPFIAGVIALAISFLCFAGEVLIIALDNLEHGVLISADSLNIKGWSLYRWILLPQLWVQIGGQILNLLLILMKESALVSSLGVLELTRAGQVYSELSGKYFLGTLIALALYWLIAEMLQNFLIKRSETYA